MTLTGQAAEQHPDIDALTPVRYGLVTHAARINGAGGRAWVTAGPGRPGFGHVDPATGAYQSAATAMTEGERRAAGLRRNGLPRRKAAV
jgi:hypothetical protein